MHLSLRCRYIPLSTLSLASAALLLGASSAEGLVQFSGDFATGTGQIQFEQDYTFTLTTAIAQHETTILVLDEAVISDGTRDHIASQAGTPIHLEIGATASTRSFIFVDNFTMTIGSLSPNDTYLYWDSPAGVPVGGSLTVKAGVYGVGANATANPQLNSLSFSGNLFLISNDGNRISGDIPAVPEPGEYALFTGLGLAGLGMWRRFRTPGQRFARTSRS